MSTPVFRGCNSSAQVWSAIGIIFVASSSSWTVLPPPQLPISVWQGILLSILWLIWDWRKSVVFRAAILPLNVILTNISGVSTFWVHRLKKADLKVDAESWRDYLSSRLMNLIEHPGGYPKSPPTRSAKSPGGLVPSPQMKEWQEQEWSFACFAVRSFLSSHLQPCSILGADCLSLATAARPRKQWGLAERRTDGWGIGRRGRVERSGY